MAAIPALWVLAGCGAEVRRQLVERHVLDRSRDTATIDTNCTGCNATNSSGSSVEQFSATLAAAARQR